MFKAYSREYFLNYLDRYSTDRHDNKRSEKLLSFFDISKADIILDAGCGVGRISAFIEGKVRMAVGLDLSMHALSMASGVYGVSDLVEGDITRLPFEDGCFDKIIVSEVIEHIKAQDILLEELNRVLKKGGEAIISTGPISSFIFHNFIHKIDKKNGLVNRFVRLDGTGEEHVAIQHPAKLKQTLFAHGFKVIKERYWNAFHLSFILSKTRIRALRQFYGVSDIIDRIFCSSMFCVDSLMLARKV